MKTKIHPKYSESKVACSCGEVFDTRSTQPEIKVEICSKCHPFYSGKQKFMGSGGRVEKFQKKYAERLKKIKEAEQKAQQQKAAEQQAKEQLAEEEKQKAESEESKVENTEEAETQPAEKEDKVEQEQDQSETVPEKEEQG